MEEFLFGTNNRKGFALLPIILVVSSVVAIGIGFGAVIVTRDVFVKNSRSHFPAPTAPVQILGDTVAPEVIPTADPDPVVDCTFTHIGTKRLKNSICKKSTECQVGDKWIYYSSVAKCKADQQNVASNANPTRTGSIVKYHDWCNNKEVSVYQNELITKKSSDGKTYSMTKDDWNCYEKYLASKGTGSGGTSTVNNYPPCTVFYPALGYSQTYSYTSPSTCSLWQSQANAGSQNMVTYPTTKPLPTSVPVPQYRDYNDPVCQNIRNEWEKVKAAIGPLDFTNHNYSNSADLMRDYLTAKDKYNAVYSSNKCTGYLQ
jgi:hypothetical protein